MVSDGVGKNEEREKENMIVKKDCINFLEKPKTNRAQHVQTDLSKVEKILKGSLDSIPSPSPLVKIQIMGRKVCLRGKGKTLLGIVNKLFENK